MFKRALFILLVLSFLVAPLALNAQSADEIARLIAELQRQIAVLKVQLAQLQGRAGWCHNFNSNLGVGSKEKDDIKSLQRALVTEGLTVGSFRKLDVALFEYGDGYIPTFGEQTASAVSAFQLKYKDEILAPLGLSNPTGYVGPATRAVLNRLYGCKKVVPPPTQKLQIISPNGGEQWVANSTKAITWRYDGATSATKVDLWLQRSSCISGQTTCTQIYYSPIVLDKNISALSTYNWIVATDIVNNPISPDNYVVWVCPAGDVSNTMVGVAPNFPRCDSSDNYFTISNVVTLPVCRPTGCSGQICSDQSITSTCEWRPQYACYRNAVCERQPAGQCGWTPSATLTQCLNSSSGY